MSTTKISDLVNPIVMADSISAKIEKKIVVSPFARIDNSLVGVPGDTIYVPQYSYIGDASDIAEGDAVDTTKLVASTTKATIKKAMKAVELTDEAVLSGYGNPVGETNNQLALAIASKVDADAMDALLSAQLQYDGSDKTINYDGIVDAIDVFSEEGNTEKVMFIHPKQMTQLRHDENFISADKYPGAVVMTGEIGMIANTRIVPSRRVTLNPEISEGYVLCSPFDEDALTVVEDAAGDGEIALEDVIADIPDAKAGNSVRHQEAVGEGVFYINPIVKIESDEQTEDEAPALTIYLKRDTNVEAQRESLRRVTDISVDKLYTVALSNNSKVVLAKFKK
ncbi:MAG: N4-gp56 family major capsid protein [Clostridia bacterium]|nr:N4-gp56 family major capsid protein [Clostridia bacterium]